MGKVIDDLSWKWGRLWGSRCPDPECRGYMMMYDGNPRRDWCNQCNLTGWQTDDWEYHKAKNAAYQKRQRELGILPPTPGDPNFTIVKE